MSIIALQRLRQFKFLFRKLDLDWMMHISACLATWNDYTWRKRILILDYS
jgi:hypothetical protein